MPEVGGGGLGDLGASLGMGLQETQKIYIRNLELLPTRLNLTFVKAEHNKDTLLGRYQSKESGGEPLGPQQAADERGDSAQRPLAAVARLRRELAVARHE